VPVYLTNYCQPISSFLSCRSLCSDVCGDLIVPPTQTAHYDPHSFAVAGPTVWNSLPAPLYDSQLTLPSSIISKHIYLPALMGTHTEHARDCGQ